jgi:hypothetical protein
MAFRTQKISQMTPKGANLEGSDLLEVSTLESGSYVTRSITGQEIIDAAAASGGVTEVTATAPLSSTGGNTPDISIPQSTELEDGYLSASDWILFKEKQDEITLTTTGTSGPATFIANTLNIPQYSGGTSNPSIISLSAINATAVTGTTANTITSAILIPANTFGSTGIIDIMGRYQKTGTSGTQNLRLYVNTSASLTGATLVANFYLGANTNAGAWRTANISSNIINFYSLNGVTNSDLGTILGTSATATFNTSVDNYIIFAIQLSSGSDSSVLQYHKVMKYV